MKQLSNRTAILVTPKEPFIKWVQSVDDLNTKITPEAVAESPNVYLVNDTINGMSKERLLKNNFTKIFEEELSGWIIDDTIWPQKRDLKMFRQWFNTRFCEIVLDIGKKPLELEDLRSHKEITVQLSPEGTMPSELYIE